jgi:hypothetical protein
MRGASFVCFKLKKFLIAFLGRFFVFRIAQQGEFKNAATIRFV